MRKCFDRVLTDDIVDDPRMVNVVMYSTKVEAEIYTQAEYKVSYFLL